MAANNFDGIWMYVKDNDYYGEPRYIIFDNDKAVRFDIETEKDGTLQLKENGIVEEMTAIRHEFITPDRLRFFTKTIHYFVYEDESQNTTEETELAEEYLRLEPTETSLTKEEIQNNSYLAQWNKEKLQIRFNTTLDSEIIQEINKKNNREGRKLVVEQLGDTLFLCFLNNSQRELLLPIKTIDQEKIVLQGYPSQPFEITGTRIR
ncbi:hypothetical protein MH928_10095 [Flavobacterium sp. WW92]|uniref:hypothetical protein n=1 Tax=unclassified Flavobacterium TaxID=196869 RepID=UPI002224475C|nr:MULTISPECIES: hypothetical protein [unclassified Flavobacterium]WDO11682.1 hypothetical protein MH928_10095 [Flavobacterium sp. WW92]